MYKPQVTRPCDRCGSINNVCAGHFGIVLDCVLPSSRTSPYGVVTIESGELSVQLAAKQRLGGK